MLSDSQIHLMAKALKWLTGLIGLAILLLAMSFEYIASEAEAVRRSELKMVENDTLPARTIKQIASLATLVARPGKYHDRPVWVKGYLNLEFEGNRLYYSEAEYAKHAYENGCRVQISDSLLRKKRVDDYSKRYVVIEGLYDNRDGEYGYGRLLVREIKTIQHPKARRPLRE